MTSTKESREMARMFREMEKAEMANPSQKAREIVKAREKENARESLKAAARDMGISVNELASDIIAERTFAAESTVTESREYEAGITLVESRERRSLVKAMILAEKATRPDYRESRELLESIGHEKGVVIASIPTGEIAVFGTYRAIDPEYARAMAARAIVAQERAAQRIDSAEKAIESAPLKKATPAMKRELANAEKAAQIARARMQRANDRVEKSRAISADGIRLEEKARFHYLALNDAIVLDRLQSAIEAWELPNAIIRRPFREYVRPNIRRNPISPVECAVLRNEYRAEMEKARELVKAETEKILAEKAESEKAEKEKAHSIAVANRRMADKMRKRNARQAKRNAR